MIQNLMPHKEKDSIKEHFRISDKLSNFIHGDFAYPHKFDFSLSIFVLSGEAEGEINLRKFKLTAPCILYIFPDQILRNIYSSDNFAARYVMLSRDFADSLLTYMQNNISKSTIHKPNIDFKEIENPIITVHLDNLQQIIDDTENPYRLDCIKHTLAAFFYRGWYKYHSNACNDTYKSNVVDKFLMSVQQHCRKHRFVSFYSEQATLSVKHLSRLVKRSTGQTAAKWIEKYVILEAQAMLKSSNMTIQQISEELNFPSQSFFGKYFKIRVGISPKEYRSL